MRARICIVVAVGLLLAADAKDDAVKKELKKLEGTWKIEGFEHHGNRLNPESWTLVIKGEKYTLTFGNTVEEGTFKIDPTKKPKTVEVTPSGGESEGKTRKGIYEVDGKSAKACFNVAGEKDRPSELATKAENEHYLWELKRD